MSKDNADSMATLYTSVVYLHQGVDKLHLTAEAPDCEASVSHSDEDVPGRQSSLMGNEASRGPKRQPVPIKDDVTHDIVINKKAKPKLSNAYQSRVQSSEFKLGKRTSRRNNVNQKTQRELVDPHFQDLPT